MAFAIQIVSDLHLEIERVGADAPGLYEYDLPVAAENLAILGDLGTTHEPRFFEWLTHQLRRFRRVFFVPGNHEPYSLSLDESTNALNEFELRHNTSRKEPLNEPAGEFILLTQTRYDVSDDLTIIGCTLWSALNPEDFDILSWSMTDFKRITSFGIEAYQTAHLADRVWLNTMVETTRVQEPHRRVVVFTHHAPTKEGTSNPRFQGGPTDSAFSSELTNEPCWGPPVVLWGFGHTHWGCDFVRLGVRVMSNPRGYDAGGQGYDATKVVEL